MGNLGSGFLKFAWETGLTRSTWTKSIGADWSSGERVLERQSELGFKPQKHHVSVGCLSLGCLQSRMRGLAYVGAKTSSSSANAYI